MTAKKKALLFGNTVGHGVTMTGITAKKLENGGYKVITVCRFVDDLPRLDIIGRYDLPRDCGTGHVEFFWGSTFLNWDFSELSEGELVVVVHLPLPIQMQLNYSAADEAIKKIKELTERKIRVILIDHHKRAIVHYGKAIEAGAELIFSIGLEQYCHYGDPDDHSLFWGPVGAISDRDADMLPIEEEEFKPFKELERKARWLDQAIRDRRAEDAVKDVLNKIKKDNREIADFSEQIPSPSVKNCGAASYCPELAPNIGHKQLDYACESQDTAYGVGIGPKKQYITVINYWKAGKKWQTKKLPVALRLPKERKAIGHDTALTISISEDERPEIHQRVKRIIGFLNSDEIEQTASLTSESDAIDYFARVFRKIPIAYNFTRHGWDHVETVMANARLLGSVFYLTSEEQILLNWAALFHDIGNGAYVSRDEYGLDVQSEKEAREKHEQYTVQILRKMQNGGLFANLISPDDFDIICDLCLRHRKKHDLPNDLKRMKLCLLLRIADALDRTKSRARQNDMGEPYSVVKKRINKEKDKCESIEHWEGQRAIDSIRLYISRDTLISEFIVSDKRKADFIIEDFKEELKKLQPDMGKGKDSIPDCEVKITLLPGSL